MEKQFGAGRWARLLLDVVGVIPRASRAGGNGGRLPATDAEEYRDAIDALFDASRFGQKRSEAAAYKGTA